MDGKRAHNGELGRSRGQDISEPCFSGNRVVDLDAGGHRRLDLDFTNQQIFSPPHRRDRRPVGVSGSDSRAPSKGQGYDLHTDRKARPMVPLGLRDILMGLSKGQRRDVEAIGFGPLLDMTVTEIPTGLNSWLVEYFCPHGRAMMTEKREALFNLMPMDVRDVYGLPYFPDNPVVPNLFSDEISRLKQSWKSNYSFDTDSLLGIKLSSFFMTMKHLRGDDFKRMFVLYMLSGFLAPTEDGKVDFSVLGALYDVNRIRELDWCSYVLDKTCASVMKYKSERTKDSNFTGSVGVLLFCYLHRVFWRGTLPPKRIPFILQWDEESLRLRIDEEVESKYFGVWRMDLKSFPISKPPAPACLNVTNSLTFKIPPGLPSDSELRRTIPENFERSIATLTRDIKVVVGERLKEITAEARLRREEHGQKIAEVVNLVGGLASDLLEFRDGMEQMKQSKCKAPCVEDPAIFDDIVGEIGTGDVGCWSTCFEAGPYTGLYSSGLDVEGFGNQQLQTSESGPSSTLYNSGLDVSGYEYQNLQTFEAGESSTLYNSGLDGAGLEHQHLQTFDVEEMEMANLMTNYSAPAENQAGPISMQWDIEYDYAQHSTEPLPDYLNVLLFP